ncbi:hypothetical protein FHW00_001564 [Ochrobactrum sp. P6BSIII]|nr:hypothetical protein [Ochrobactrum sp. P6BSIII]
MNKAGFEPRLSFYLESENPGTANFAASTPTYTAPVLSRQSNKKTRPEGRVLTSYVSSAC